MLYHVSPTAGLTVLEPHVSTHGQPYVYAVENPVIGLLFGARHDDFDFFISSDEHAPAIYECYPDAFRLKFQGKACSLYEIGEEGFLRGMTSWSAELVNPHEVPVLREIPVPDLHARLLEEAAAGNLIIHRYESTAEYRQMISRHVVDRLIRFNVLDSEDMRIKTHYARLVEGLKSLMDGHLLQP